jgi:hypothetical protein
VTKYKLLTLARIDLALDEWFFGLVASSQQGIPLNSSQLLRPVISTSNSGVVIYNFCHPGFLPCCRSSWTAFAKIQLIEA